MSAEKVDTITMVSPVAVERFVKDVYRRFGCLTLAEMLNRFTVPNPNNFRNPIENLRR